MLLPPNPAQVVLEAGFVDLDGSPKLDVSGGTVLVYSIVSGLQSNLLSASLVQVGSSNVWRYVWAPSALGLGQYLVHYSATDANGQTTSGVEEIDVIVNAPPPPMPGGGLNTVVLPGATAAMLAMAQNAFGVDVLCVTDLDPNFSLVPNALPQDVWHLISEQPGSIFWAAIQTFNVRSLVSKGVVPATLPGVQTIIQSVIQGDERVASCQVTATFDGQETITIQVNVFPEQGSAFNLVVSINKVTITLVSVGLVNL